MCFASFYLHVARNSSRPEIACSSSSSTFIMNLSLILVILGVAVVFATPNSLMNTFINSGDVTTDEAADCPNIPQNLNSTIFSFKPNNDNSTIYMLLCGTFSDGCYPKNGAGACMDGTCCSVCQRWNENGPNEGAWCLGKSASYTLSGGVLNITQTGGDPVNTTYGRQTYIILSCNTSFTTIGIGNINLTLPAAPIGNNYVYTITAGGSFVCAAPPQTMAPGYIFLIVLAVLVVVGVIGFLIFRAVRRGEYTQQQ